MPVDLPYMPSVANVPAIFDKIKGAGTPPKFTHDFLKTNLGFGSSNDRSVIKILRSLGFLTADGVPTQRYNDFKGTQGKAAVAEGLREGWSELFLSDQKIYEKSAADILATVKGVSGAGDAVARKMATTFKALCDQASWNSRPQQHGTIEDAERESPEVGEQSRPGQQAPILPDSSSGLLRLHHDIHLHLPPTSDVSVYRAIFQALKMELM
ncbi:DUF5343 domain-containing protein [Diaminobutyricibacter tongyongensis]|uniref:DUF5343 domain-containing protein n=1 Tax=Leifsonia tongyongensis TaxID=1268043 RepID=A0A6L9XZX3_9MICO|nr:DUF5343 domain-containing protein [Diaminobutyricibacter tongyongensis]NEN06568.1 DUF5343 domain-containing protein [Diaminobutyricibacter tongyongensis]